MSDINATAPQPRDVIRAFHLLSRLPLPGGDGVRSAASAWAWPLVGTIVAVLQIGVGLGALAFGVPLWAAAGLSVTVGVVFTGALHEDGLADCADGFWGGHDPDHRLEILKDSRIGSFGVLALIFAIGFRCSLFAALLQLDPLTLITAAMLSRCAMSVLMIRLPFARNDGLARHVGAPPRWSVALGCGIALIGACICAGIQGGVAASIAVMITTFATSTLARTKIGGQTGDVLGATQILSEIAALTTLVVVVS